MQIVFDVSGFWSFISTKLISELRIDFIDQICNASDFDLIFWYFCFMFTLRTTPGWWWYPLWKGSLLSSKNRLKKRLRWIIGTVWLVWDRADLSSNIVKLFSLLSLTLNVKPQQNYIIGNFFPQNILCLIPSHKSLFNIFWNCSKQLFSSFGSKQHVRWMKII